MGGAFAKIYWKIVLMQNIAKKIPAVLGHLNFIQILEWKFNLRLRLGSAFNKVGINLLISILWNYLF